MRPFLLIDSIRTRAQRVTRIGIVVLLTGLGAGLGGMMLALLLHTIQHIAYGYSLDSLVGTRSFLEGVSAASPSRRIAVMAACGVLAGVGWWAIKRFGKPLISIERTLDINGPPMPVGATLAHVLLQIATVALGSPLGREVAPRELGALIAAQFAKRAHLNDEDTRLILACGAGAGLAAVYNVPLAGGIFALEVLLRTFNLRAAAAALGSSAIAALIAWIGLGDESQYSLPTSFTLNSTLVAWALISGPLFGVAAWGFSQVTTYARRHAPSSGWRMSALMIVNFTAIGVLAVYFPQLLGNGKSAAQLSFDGHLSIGLAIVLLLLKSAVIVSSLRVGAYGGLLTPSLAIGALLGIALGGVGHWFSPDIPAGAFALIGATALLASSMSMPITAIALIIEFTHPPHDLFFPILFAVAGAVCVRRLCQ